jgi:hypothetical protein
VISKAFDFMYELFLSNTSENPQTIRRWRDVAYDDFVHTVTVCDGLLYWKHKGNPSGNVLTCVVNSIVNDLMVMTSVVSAMKKIPKQIAPKDYLKFLHENLDWVNLGDDLVVAVGAELQPWFPFNVIQEKMRDIFNITMTHPSKDESREVEQFTPLQECSFLSRTFACDDGFMVWPQLKKETINSLLHWTSSNTTLQLSSNLRMAIEEALFWDKAYFDQIAKIVELANKRYGTTVVIPSYHHMRTRVEAKVRTGANQPASFSIKSNDCVLPLSHSKRILNSSTVSNTTNSD